VDTDSGIQQRNVVNPGRDVPNKKKERIVSEYNTNYAKIIYVKSVTTNYRENVNDMCYISL
jgi:hypothetical protein